MRIAYCANVRLPSERAHAHQIAQVCDALIMLGHEVTVFAPHRRETVDEPFHSYYGVSDRIKVQYIGNRTHVSNWKPLRPLRLWLMNRGLRSAYATELRPDRFDLLYTRTPALLSSLLATGIPTILELHQLPRRARQRFVEQASQCVLVAALTSSMRSALVAWGIPAQRVIAEGDAVDLRRFVSLPEQEAAKREWGFRTDRIVVGYVGRLKTLFMEKGVSHLLQALAILKNEKKFMGLIVGGPEEDRREYQAQADKLGMTVFDVVFAGHVPNDRVPSALAACDVLAMPFPDFPHYRFHMSPLKMFEYMAAGKPLLTSDLPTVRDVLSEKNAVFCEPGNVESLVAALRWIAAHRDEAHARAVQARRDVERHTWEERMKRILGAYAHPPSLAP